MRSIINELWHGNIIPQEGSRTNSNVYFQGDIKHRFAEIVRGELFMSHPKDLNDPFDTCFHLSSTDPASYMIDKATYEEQFFDKIPEDKYKEIFSGENWFDLLITYIAKTIPNQESIEKTRKFSRK